MSACICAQLAAFAKAAPAQREEVDVSDLVRGCVYCGRYMLVGAASHIDCGGDFVCASCCNPCQRCAKPACYNEQCASEHCCHCNTQPAPASPAAQPSAKP
jgi:hypothetical protein